MKEQQEELTKDQWADYFLEKAKYLSENVGMGKMWDRFVFKHEIIDTLLQVADKAQSQALIESNKQIDSKDKEISELTFELNKAQQEIKSLEAALDNIGTHGHY